MSTNLPPGRYFIGDPCYVFSRSDWDNFACDAILDGRETIQDLPYFAAHTLNGDGLYKGSNGFEFGVDAGLLGAIPVALITKTPDPGDGIIVDCPGGLDCEENDGIFTFGGLVIDTRKSEGGDEDADLDSRF